MLGSVKINDVVSIQFNSKFI